MSVFDVLQERGFIKQLSHEEEIKELLEKEKVTFYIGFDPTADSLHVGHFIALMLMSHMQKAGHRPICLLGGGTGMVGDPSGKDDMRKMLTPEFIAHNIACFKKQMSRFIDFTDDKAIMVNNADWLMDLNYIQLLREVGVHFSVNRMLAAECFKKRLEKGMTFFEFNYMIMQAYDFYHLHNNYGCNMQFGGDDQWSNMLAGTELIRKKTGKDAYAMTITLLMNSEGKKMGKTAKGAVWLDSAKTSPFEFFQYWRNVDDADVIKCMKLLTFIPLDKIAEYEKKEGSELNAVKEVLAYEITSMVHGTEEADKALQASKALFGGGCSDENMPTTTVNSSSFTDGQISVIDLLVISKLAPSKGEARRLIQQGGVSINDVKITDFAQSYGFDEIKTEPIIVKKGKKTFHKIIAE